jgi:hypothetical protein
MGQKLIHKTYNVQHLTVTNSEHTTLALVNSKYNKIVKIQFTNMMLSVGCLGFLLKMPGCFIVFLKNPVHYT